MVEYYTPGGTGRNSLEIDLYSTAYRDSADLEEELSRELNMIMNKNDDAYLSSAEDWRVGEGIPAKYAIVFIRGKDPTDVPEAVVFHMCSHLNWFVKATLLFPIPLTAGGGSTIMFFRKLCRTRMCFLVVLPKVEAPTTF